MHTYWQLRYMQNCGVLCFHFQIWKIWLSRNNGRLTPKADLCEELTTLWAISSLWMHDYIHIFILSTLIVLRTLRLLLSWGIKALQKCCPFMLFQNNVPKSNRRASPVVSRGFEESAVSFWSPLYELVKFPVNKQFFEHNILSSIYTANIYRGWAWLLFWLD